MYNGRAISESYDTEMKEKTSVNPTHSYVVWGMAAFFYLYEVILRVSPSVMTTQLMEHFQISATSLGWLSTSYYVAYFILQIPCGLVVDKFGPRRVISLSALICVFGTLLFCTQNDIYVAMFGRFMIGAGSACAFISCLKLATDWFPPHRFALMAGITNMMGTLGATFAGRPLAKMVNTLGWQESCLYLAAFGLFVSAFVWILVRDKVSVEIPTPFKQSLSVILKAKQVWLIGIIGGVLYLPITAFAELWGVPYLMEAYHINNETASQATVMIFIGTAIGSPVFAYIAKSFQSFKKAMILCAVGASTLFIGVSMAGFLSYITVFIMLFLIGFMIGGQVLAFTIAKDNTPDDANGTAMGLTNALVSFVGLVFQPLLGSILDFFWTGEVSETGVRLYTLYTYEYAIYTLPVTLVASTLLLGFVRETYIKK